MAKAAIGTRGSHRGIATAGTFLSALIFCVSSLAAAVDASSPAISKGRWMWMRGGVLLAEPKGRAGWLVPDPVEVEVADDNRVRLVDDKGRSRTGWCPSQRDVSDFGMKNVFTSLGLYAQADGPLKTLPGGTTVGRVSAGAFVPVQEMGREWAKVELPFVEPTGERFVVSVALLGMERKSMSIDDSPDWVPKHGRVLRMTAERSSRIFARTWCLPAESSRSRKLMGASTS
jgi:hypothetical protein